MEQMLPVPRCALVGTGEEPEVTHERDGARRRRRVRWTLLVLLWLWAASVFLVLDLFLNVSVFDEVRPTARIYRATRYAAHRLVGEPYEGAEFGSDEALARPRDVAQLDEEHASPASPSPTVMSRPWINDALQTRDPQLRLAALASIRDALLSGDPARMQAGLVAIVSIDAVTYDRQTYRELVVPLLAHDLPRIRAAALAALPYTVKRKEDLARVVPLAKDASPSVRLGAARAIVLLSGRDLTVEGVSPAMLSLLEEDSPSQLRQYILAINNARLSDAVEGRLLELLRDEKLRQHVVHGPLSTAVAKSPRVVGALLEILEGPDATLYSQAIRGLEWNIPDESRGAVADAFVRLLWARNSRPTHHQSLTMIGRYGEERHIGEIQRYLSNPMVNQGNIDAARAAIRQIRER